MVCNDEQTMMGILPTTNEWPQSFTVIMPATTPSTSNSNSSTTSTPDTAALPRHPGPLNCPRCNSTNTKFCYYNNYSLTQPRHFCKSCKRYWTRGGTLRNVPVGGGCRKNKRAKKSSPSPSTITTNPTTLSLPQPIISRLHSSTANINPNFSFDLTNNNVSYSNLQQRMHQYAGPGFYDLQPQMNALGLGFTQNNVHQFAANITESTTVSSAVQEFPYPIFGSSATAASLLVSSLKQPRKLDEFQNLFQYDDHQVGGSLGVMLNQVKLEGDGIGSGADWNLSYDQTPLDAMAAAVTASTTAPTDSSFMYWNSAWPETTNYGSSIAPLI